MSREWVAGDVARFNERGAFEHIVSGSLVIDLSDDEAARRIAAWLYDKYGIGGDNTADHLQAALRSLVEPPKPEEPTVGGMVETRDGEEWFHANVPNAPWMNGNRWAFYSDLDAVRVIVPGVTP